jgi:hypothetical protein
LTTSPASTEARLTAHLHPAAASRSGRARVVAIAAATLLGLVLAPARTTAQGAAPNPVPVAAGSAGVRPFKASYVLSWKGISAASADLDLTRTSDGHYTYVSRNLAKGLFRLAFPGEIMQKSTLQIDGDRVVPLSYRGDDGTSSSDRDVSLDYDWSAGRVRGIAEKEKVDLELRPDAQDPMTVQIAMIMQLAAGREPREFWLVDKKEIKEYRYTREAPARVRTAFGEFDTVVYSSRRPDSDRITRVWYAPALGYTPVKAERVRGDKQEWAMSLVSLTRS